MVLCQTRLQKLSAAVSCSQCCSYERGSGRVSNACPISRFSRHVHNDSVAFVTNNL